MTCLFQLVLFNVAVSSFKKFLKLVNYLSFVLSAPAYIWLGEALENELKPLLLIPGAFHKHQFCHYPLVASAGNLKTCGFFSASQDLDNNLIY